MRIHHHKFTVMDMDRSLRFYRDLLGFEVMYDVERSDLPSYDQIMGRSDIRVRIALLRDRAAQIIALLQFRNPPVQPRPQDIFFQGSSQISIEVADIEAEFRRLIDAGVRARSGPVEIVRDGKAVAKACYVHDPDDIAIELYQPLK